MMSLAITLNELRKFVAAACMSGNAETAGGGEDVLIDICLTPKGEGWRAVWIKVTDWGRDELVANFQETEITFTSLEDCLKQLRSLPGVTNVDMLIPPDDLYP